MKAKKIRLFALTSVLATCLSAGLVSCNGTVNFDKYESNVIFERRLWSKTDASEINVSDPNNAWTYKTADEEDDDSLPYFKNDGTIRLRNEGDSITSESFNTKKPFSVDLTMSLNGGQALPSGLHLEKGDLAISIEALNGKGTVVSSVLIDDPAQLPQEKSMEVVRVKLNATKKQVSRIRITLVTPFYKNRLEVNIGIGRIKVYEGEQKQTFLPDGVTSDYVSDVEYTNYEAENYENIPTKGIRLSDVRKNSYDLASRGNQNVLVIPVRFADTDPSKLHVYNSVGIKNRIEIEAADLGGYDGIRKTIEQAYFGETSETGWESLSSYYYKSSNGKLNITGKVSEWFTYEKTVTEFYQEGDGSSSVYNLVNAACQWYKENFDDYAMFDQNNDGYFDCVEFVYAQPNCNSNSLGVCNSSKYKNAADLFWAFCWKRSGVEAMKNWPTPFTFAWFSYDFLYNNFNTTYFEKDEVEGRYTSLKADTHTVVHENGHALGLADYYSTGYDGTSPLAGVDMMDHNIGDHNAYSKWLLDWYGPKEQIVYDANNAETKSYRVTLKPFESSGDFVIIPAYTHDQLMTGKNPGKLDSAYNEYISIEYYTPTGLNELDSKEGYTYETGAKTMSENGIKMFHVDSRLAYISYSSTDGKWMFNSYLPVNADVDLVGGSGSTFAVELAHRNGNSVEEQNFDTGEDPNRDYRLISALFADVNDRSETGKYGYIDLANKHLWGSKESKVNDFGITNHKNFTFNNGFKNLYSMEIESISDEEVTLVFTYMGE